MKKLGYLFFAVLFLASCASRNMPSEKQKEVAVATQRVGEQYYNSGRHTDALKNLLEAYETIPDDPYLNNSLGLVYLAKERYDLAEKHFKKALDLKSDYIQAKNNLGAVYVKQEKWAQAIACFEEVSKNLLYPTPEIPLSNLGLVYFHQKMYKKAKLYFNKSLETRHNLFAVHGLVLVDIETGDYAQAVDFLHHELERDPGAAILHSDLAKAYEGLNDFTKARRAWNVVLKLEPETSPLAREAQKRLSDLN